MNTVPFTKKDIKNYLDIKIQSWRKEMEICENRNHKTLVELTSMAFEYINIYQSIRKDLFGKVLK